MRRVYLLTSFLVRHDLVCFAWICAFVQVLHCFFACCIILSLVSMHVNVHSIVSLHDHKLCFLHIILYFALELRRFDSSQKGIRRQPSGSTFGICILIYFLAQVLLPR